MVWKLMERKVNEKIKIGFILVLLLVFVIFFILVVMIFEVKLYSYREFVENVKNMKNSIIEMVNEIVILEYCWYMLFILGKIGSGIYWDFFLFLFLVEFLLLVVLYIIVYVLFYIYKKWFRYLMFFNGGYLKSSIIKCEKENNLFLLENIFMWGIWIEFCFRLENDVGFIIV